MAAQKLTKARLVQIIIMLAVLITAFIWRTINHESNETIKCIVSKPCEIGTDKHSILILDNDLGYSIKASEIGAFSIGYNGNGILEEKEPSNWLLQTSDKTPSILVTFTQQAVTFNVKIFQE
ncbi:hypothetical protein AB4427_06885 [Vibrio artabrorum]|uniref:hypothetical protein n=1 Tax=Vibrio artabrorum TaxID=446374 RepID=UPI00354AE862